MTPTHCGEKGKIIVEESSFTAIFEHTPIPIFWLNPKYTFGLSSRQQLPFALPLPWRLRKHRPAPLFIYGGAGLGKRCTPLVILSLIIFLHLMCSIFLGKFTKHLLVHQTIKPLNFAKIPYHLRALTMIFSLAGKTN